MTRTEMMIRKVVAAGAAFILLPGLLPAAAPVMTIDRDTPVPLRLVKTISSAAAHANDRVEFEVTRDVRFGDIVAIPRGSRAWGVVADAARRSRLGRPGKLEIDIRAVCMGDGQAASLRGMPSSGARASAAPVESDPSNNLLMLPALPVLVFLYGKDVEIPAGRQTTAYLAEPAQLSTTELTSGPHPGCGIGNGAKPSAVAGLSSVQVRSSQAGQEIQVDGKYAGETPALLRLPAGTHKITILNSTGERWERSIYLTPGGETQVTAQFQAAPEKGDVRVARADEE